MPNLITTVLSVFAAQTTAACTREALKVITDEYLAAQTAGQTTFPSLSNIIAYTETRKTVGIITSILSKPLKINHARSQYDTTQGAAFSEVIVTNTTAPYVIATQLRFDNTTQVSQIDTVWTTKGDWLFNVKVTYYWATREQWDVIPVEKRDSRAVVKSAGDAYCDLSNDNNVVVPWGSPCARP